jgi:CheY-like chemotaxis protein
LVVDDDEDVRTALEEILDAEGYRTVLADSATNALELLRTGAVRPSLILLDLLMPEMDGWEFLILVDDDPDLHRIPVALMSSHPSVRRAFDNQLKEHGSTRLLLPKPLSLMGLLSTAEHFCA